MRLAPLLLALFGMLASPGCLEDAPAPSADADPKAAALAFGLDVLETYFTGDADAFLAMTAETTYTLEGEGPYTTADVARWIQEETPFPSGKDYTSYTLQDYLAVYAPEVWTFDEVAATYPEVENITWDGWTPDADDLVFVGNIVREGKEPFLWDDLLSFAITRETGEWRFKAFSG